MENPTQSPPSAQQQAAETPLLPTPLTISLSFKNGQTKTLERFLTARIRFETPDAERAELYKVFRHFDTDGDGNLSLEEIRNSLEKLGILVSAADITSLVSYITESHAQTDNGHAEDVPAPAGS
ncbi:hypothetical protein GOP47_0013041 [Adiantum capillus-veneris]|uniref:EF-hand domain-containing protein n=1 Tax=Adiantum capillus-veneris TaxID=13818 RepID=A0A9D4US81_ADICA|nr:hypothetical protein GOP47_0013041 [Adiantum capillus-veneris]